MTLVDLREQAKSAFLAGVAAANPALTLRKELKKQPLETLSEGGQYIIIAAGKAACKMAQSAIRALPEGAEFSAIAVTNYENVTDIDGCRVLGAAHPVPDANGQAAARDVIALLETATEHDVVLALISGGSSALLPAPVRGISLQDKSDVNQVLLTSGLDINRMNLVRQALSDLKGGGLLRYAEPAIVKSYILSDVLGDDLRAVGSGPSIGPIGTIAEARDVLIETGHFDKLPESVRHYLMTADPRPTQPVGTATLICSNGQSLAAMASTINATLVTEPLTGDVHDAAKRIINDVKSRKGTGPFAVAYGGETTVELVGDGRGGRNQELALLVAKYAQNAGIGGTWCFLSGGTDGRDGPTDAAGGLVDSQTLERIAKAGGDIAGLLANNDSYAALKLSDDLLMTGATGTNVADLQLFLIA
jgi:glycerate 2-kinase